MTIDEIKKMENDRDVPEKYGIVHLLKEGNFYRARDWSLWILKNFLPEGTDMKITAKKLKDDYLEVFWGFPLTSIGKFIPQDDSVSFNPVTDNQIDVTIPLSDDILSKSYEELRKAVDDWKSSLPLTNKNDENGGGNRRQHREEQFITETEPRITRISDILGAVLSFPLESKSPMEAYDFLRQLRQQIVRIF